MRASLRTLMMMMIVMTRFSLVVLGSPRASWRLFLFFDRGASPGYA